MTTKWGVCKVEKKRLWFNLQLAEKPTVCLEYIILHELLHLVERQHNAHFIAMLDEYMPHWRELRGDLNEMRLDYFAVGGNCNFIGNTKRASKFLPKPFGYCVVVWRCGRNTPF